MSIVAIETTEVEITHTQFNRAITSGLTLTYLCFLQRYAIFVISFCVVRVDIYESG